MRWGGGYRHLISTDHVTMGRSRQSIIVYFQQKLEVYSYTDGGGRTLKVT
ncbi:hypothetical protein Hanom_Chr05g00418681 [Helianthus anomalus]